MNVSAADRQPLDRRGVTLIELLIVMGIISLMLAISYPTALSAIEGVRLRSAADQAGSFWAAARQYADRRQIVVQVTADPKAGALRAVAADGSWRKELPFKTLRILVPAQSRSFMLYPGTPSPQFELMLATAAGERSGVRVNVLTGVPEPWQDGE